MSKQPSAETQLKTLRRDYNKKCAELSAALEKLSAAQSRITVLQAQVSIWERRHDKLIEAIGRNKP